MTDSYDEYIRAEWRLFSADPARATAVRECTHGLPRASVLDVGCGAGQELRPFLDDPGAFGVGLDVVPQAGLTARQLFAEEQPGSHVAFLRAAAEHLPFRDCSFDVVICRLALPCADNAQTIAELAQVLKEKGVLFVRFHHVSYYTRKLRDAIAAARLKPAIHACRVLVAGCLYHVTGSQPRGWPVGGETFQTMWLLRRVC